MQCGDQEEGPVHGGREEGNLYRAQSLLLISFKISSRIIFNLKLKLLGFVALPINRTFLGENHSQESKYRENYEDPGNRLDREVGQSEHSEEHENPSNIPEEFLNHLQRAPVGVTGNLCQVTKKDNFNFFPTNANKIFRV